MYNCRDNYKKWFNKFSYFNFICVIFFDFKFDSEYYIRYVKYLNLIENFRFIFFFYIYS